MGKTTTWLDNDCGRLEVGDVGFLVVRTNPYQHWERTDLNDRPAHTNMSGRPMAFGWCGQTNDVSVSAEGVARVIRIARNERACVVRLRGAEARAAYEELGYPDLADDDPLCGPEVSA